MTGWILRAFAARDQVTMTVLFKAMVLPVVEYCCQLWSPRKQYLIRNIEAIQRHFTAKMEGMNGLSYRQRLAKLNMYSLERRRDRYTVIYLWKILQGQAPNMLGNDQIRTVENPRLGRLCLLPPLNNKSSKHIQTLRENSFSVFAPKLFNELGPDLRNFNGSMEAFKNRLDCFLQTIKDEPHDPEEPPMAASNSLRDQIVSKRMASRSNPTIT